MSNTENDPFISAFEPLTTNVNHKSIKRRSSILKSVDVNYGEVNRNEERRGSRRVSWAHTFQYKELLADGTAVIMCHELNSNVSEDIYGSVPQIEGNNVDNNENQSIEQKSDECEENKINASEFINRLKANTSLNKSFAENTNKRHQSSEEQKCSKPKKVKKNSKGLTNYLVKHYNTEDKKDYETVFNTSFNKYGREVVPRTERPDFTQLFTDENNAMTLTEIIELSHESNNRTDRMAVTLNESTAAMNISDCPQELIESNKTRYFTDESLAMTDCTETMALSESITEDKKDNETVFNTSFNIYGREVVPQTERPEFTQLFADENNAMTLTEIIELSHESNNRTDRMGITFNESTSDMNISDCPQELIESNKTRYFTDESIAMTDCTATMALSECTEGISLSNDGNTDQTNTTEPNDCVESNSISKITVPSLTSRIPKPSISTLIPQPVIRKSIISSIQLPNNNKFSMTKNMEQNKRSSAPRISMSWLAQSTHQYNNTIAHNVTQSNQDLAEQTVKPAMTTTTLQISNLFKRPERKSIQCSQTITPVLPNKCISPTVPIKESNEDIAIKSNRPLMNNTTTVRPNRFSLTARLELSKSVVKDAFGLGMTERLKQKRDEFEAKRRQSIENKAFTPNVSNSVNISESQSILHSIPNKDVTQLSTDLFNSKTSLETNEEMEVEENMGSDPEIQSSDSESNSKSKSDMNSKSFSETKSNSEITSDSKSDSLTENLKSNSGLKSIESSITSSDKSQTSSLDLNSTSPLSISVVHSSDNYLVSSPATIDPTLDFTFHRSDSSDSFDPFVHTNHSFHTTRSFYESTSPLQLSFMVREDTLCILADELERQIEDIVIPAEDQKLSISSTEELDDMFTPLRKLKDKRNGFTYEVLNEDKALISYLWGTFALEIRFGNVITTDSTIDYTVRDIISINMKSLIGAEEPLQMRQNNLILKFNDSHKPLITIAHDLIISSFESERQLIISKHKTSASLDQLISDISVRVLSAKRLLSELRIISSTDICRLYPKHKDRYRLVVEILGLRKPIHLIIPINAKSYPDEVIHPLVRISDEDKHLYCVQQFSAAFLRIESRKFDYIRRLIRATKAFIRAKKRIIYEKQKNLKQKQAIESARLVESFIN